MKRKQTLSSRTLRVTFEQTEAHVPLVQVEDRISGMVWGPSPAFGLEVLDICAQRTERPAPTSVTLAKRGGRIELAAAQDWYGLKFVITFAIDRGELLVRIPTAQIKQTRPLVAKLGGVHVLPTLLETNKRHPGHLVLPIQNGALLWPARHQRLHDAFLIYGQQPRWEDLTLLPCCGAVREKSQAALLAIATAGECDAECKVDLDGHGEGVTGFSMRYVYTWIDPVDPIDRAIRYVPLRGQDAGYQGMGRRMFQHVGELSGRGTLKERAAQNPALEYAATAYTVKVFHAHKQIGSLDGSGEYNVWTTFDEAGKQLSFLKQHGLERVWVQNVGWQPWGHDGEWPTRWPVNKTLGGEAAFRRFIAHGKSLGYQMCVHDNQTEGFFLSPELTVDRCVGGIHGGPLVRGVWSGGVSYPFWAAAWGKNYFRDQLLKVKDLGIDGVYYLDDMGIPLELTYNPKHGAARYRRAFAESFQARLRTAANLFHGCATEMGYLYVAAHVDSIASACYPHFFLKTTVPLMDQHVPLWCMAVKGHIFYESDVLKSFCSSDGPPDRTMAVRLLEMAEIGMKPRTETCYRSASWLSYPVEASIAAMKLDRDLMLDKLRSTLLEPLVDHEVVSGALRDGDHVTRSRFGDGTEVVCDYRRQRLHINGDDYPLPIQFKKNKPIPVGQRLPGAAR